MQTQVRHVRRGRSSHLFVKITSNEGFGSRGSEYEHDSSYWQLATMEMPFWILHHVTQHKQTDVSEVLTVSVIRPH
jgi:hypothetical protein